MKALKLLIPVVYGWKVSLLHNTEQRTGRQPPRRNGRKYDLQPDAMKDGFGEEGEDGDVAETEDDAVTDDANDGF